MGTTAEKLQAILNSKENIRQAINDKDVIVDADVKFADYASKISEITSGGVAPEPTDPVYVYKTQRNAEWLNMLGSGYGENYDEMKSYYDTADNEIRLLFHLQPPADNLIAFTCTTSSGQYNVSYYDKNDNLISTDVNSNTIFEANLIYDDFKHEMLDGTRQVLIVITPTTIGNNLLIFKPNTNSLKTSPPSYMNWTVVEMMGKTTSGINITPSGSGSTNRQFKNLEFYTLFGTNLVTSMSNIFNNCSSLTAIPELDTSSVTSMNQMFYYCYSLTAIPELDTSSVTSMYNMFTNCYSLTAIPELDTSSVTSMNQVFYNCSSLTAIPELDTSSVKDMNQMFANCYSLTTIPELDTSSVTNMNQMFYYCYSLTTIPELDTSSVTSMNQMFANCSSLTAVPQLDTSSVTTMSNMFTNTQTLKTLTITATGWAGVSFSITSCSLGYQALLNLLGSLPVVSGTPTLTITANIGRAQLWAEVLAETPPVEYTQAVSRGWTIIS